MLRRRASSSSGTHSWAGPRAMPKKFRLSAFEPAVSFGDVGRDGKGGSIEWVAKKGIAARKTFSFCAEQIGEVDRLLVDEQLLEGKGQGGVPNHGEPGHATTPECEFAAEAGVRE